MATTSAHMETREANRREWQGKGLWVRNHHHSGSDLSTIDEKDTCVILPLKQISAAFTFRTPRKTLASEQHGLTSLYGLFRSTAVQEFTVAASCFLITQMQRDNVKE